MFIIFQTHIKVLLRGGWPLFGVRQVSLDCKKQKSFCRDRVCGHAAYRTVSVHQTC